MVEAPTISTVASSSSSAARRSTSPSLNAWQKASSARGVGARGGSGFGSASFPRPRWSAAFTAPTDVERISAISSSVAPNASLSTTAARSCGESCTSERARGLAHRPVRRRGGLGAGLGSGLGPADAIDPEVRGDPEQPRTRVARVARAAFRSSRRRGRARPGRGPRRPTDFASGGDSIGTAWGAAARSGSETPARPRRRRRSGRSHRS